MDAERSAGRDGGRDAGQDAVRLSPLDNVATVLRPIAAGEEIRVGIGEAVSAREPIPFCHKVALRPIAVGEAVLKYGHPIGGTTTAVEPGQHVHVHNMRSARAAGPFSDGASGGEVRRG